MRKDVQSNLQLSGNVDMKFEFNNNYSAKLLCSSSSSHVAVFPCVFSCPISSRPTLVTDSLTHWLCWIQSLPAFQTKPKPCKIDWGHKKTWPTKRQWRRQIQRQWQIHLENTFKEQSLRLLTFETFDQGDEKTWPDQQKDNDEDKHNDNDNDKDNDKYI